MGDGTTFAYVWKVPALQVDGKPVMAALNGATKDLIFSWDPNPSWRPSGCGPRSILGTTADADPQNPFVAERSGLAATPSSEVPGYTHEAHWPEASGAAVNIRGWRGTSPASGDSCTKTSGVQHYEIMPLPTVDQKPYYGNGDDQKIGGDAMWKTYQAMDAFSELGWDGYDDQGSISRIVIDGDCPAENAKFVKVPEPAGPTNSVLICPKGTRTYSSAASLDLVAHEWGHGIVFESAGWVYDILWRRQIHEGWADVIGHGVEWRKEGATSSDLETEDWEYEEDSGAVIRQVNFDDGPYNTGDNPYSYHADDQAGANEGHHGGMRLAVAYWLAADGSTDNGLLEHLNPVCIRNPIPAYVDCDSEDEVTPLGDWNALKIFFRILTVYAADVDDFNDFAEYGKSAAHDFFAVPSGPFCTNAEHIQDSIQDAFTAIGYEGPTPANRVCSYCSGCTS